MEKKTWGFGTKKSERRRKKDEESGGKWVKMERKPRKSYQFAITNQSK